MSKSIVSASDLHTYTWIY